MPITDILDKNCELYGNETALIEINPEVTDNRRVTWKEYNLIEANPTTHYRREIQKKLKEKGISDSIIENALSDFDMENEQDLLKHLMLKKAPNPSELDYKERMKLFSFLYRKGFSPDSIERAFRDF